ncbi:MAG: ABC transporter permease [Flavobacteriia bacterium]|nr:ABC transporter permease [Flavobacteriia bacterium]
MRLFDSDRWAEIWNTLSKNRTRTILTGFGVAWGIALLIIMMGSGKGLENGITRDMGNVATNSMFLWTQRTTVPYKGFQRGRSFNLKNTDVELIKSRVSAVELVCPRTQLGGYRGSNNVIHKDKTGAFNVYGDVPEYWQIEPKILDSGRWLNQADIDDGRKVCVIGKRVEEMLFESGEEVVGSSVKINGVYFSIVGVYESARKGDQAEGDRQSIYIPISTFQRAFNWGDNVGWMSILMNPDADADRVQVEVKQVLARRHSVHPEDLAAFGSWSMKGEFENIKGLFTGIQALSLFVSIFSLLAGAIGISNIMLVVVKERTKELGVRRALGATPRQIISQIISESLILTVIAGSIGIIFGTWLMEGIDKLIGESVDTFLHPTVRVDVVLYSLATLIVFGILAGLLPAYRAVQVKPVEALRTE